MANTTNIGIRMDNDLKSATEENTVATSTHYFLLYIKSIEFYTKLS